MPKTRNRAAGTTEFTPTACVRTGMSKDDIKQSFLDSLFCGLGRLPVNATRNDLYTALAMAVRDRVLKQGVRTIENFIESDARLVTYLSAEFLTGPHLGNGLINLGIWQAVEEALSRVGQELPELLEQEEEPGLGNGGLGRLAACYMDSLAT